MTTKSRGAIAYQTNGPMVIDTIDVDSPGPGEVLVEIKGTGLGWKMTNTGRGATKA
jgi:Zn-dependent alcohol dehydrogenase